MTAFAAVLHLDTFELAGSLRTRWGLFKTEEAGHRVLRIRGTAKGAEESDDKFGAYPAAQKWPELGNLRGEIARRAEAVMPPGIEYGRIFMEMLDAGAAMERPAETAPYFTRWSRAIVALRTNPGVLVVCGAETLIPQIGWLTVVSPRLPGYVANMGDHPAVWLALDFRKKDATDG